MNKGIAVAGNMVADKIKVIEAFPTRGELVHVLSIEDACGGAACNTGMDLARLDPSLPVSVYGVAGEDENGEGILRAFHRFPNIDTRGVKRRGRNAFTDVLTESESRARTFLYYPGACDLFCEDDVPVETLSCDIFHIGYILLLAALDEKDDAYGTRMARLLKRVQAAGIRTSVDVVSEAGERFQTLVPPSLKYADYFIVNEIEAGKTAGVSLRDETGALLTGRMPEALSRLKRMGVKRWCVIHAPEGGWGMDENGCLACAPARALPKGYIKGTVGAGDAFCAGALYAAYQGKTLAQALCWASAVAACSLGAPGGTEGVPTMEEALKRFE